jgi:hypothetical protein
MFDTFGVSLLVGLAVLFAWLTRRAWHANRRVLKWSGAVLSGLLTLVFAGALAAALVGYAKLNRKYDNPVPRVSVDVTPESCEGRAVRAPAGCPRSSVRALRWCRRSLPWPP